MGFNNPSWSWSELEARAVGDCGTSEAPPGVRRGTRGVTGRHGVAHGNRSKRRQTWEKTSTATVPYAELHCHSNFSFLDGASHPEELATEAARLGLEALAITDHDGLYGIVRFAEAAKAVGLPTVFGAEIGLTVRNGELLTHTVARSEYATVRQIRPARFPTPTHLTPRERTCWSWPTGPTATPGCTHAC